MIYVNLCVQYICPLNKFYILLQNKVFNIYENKNPVCLNDCFVWKAKASN